MFYMNPQERKRLAEWRANNPTAPLRAEERALKRQAEADGRQDGQRLAAQTEKERADALAASVPEHLRRPANNWAELVKRLDGHAHTPEDRAKLARYKDRAAARDAEIDKEMESRRQAFDREHDPGIQRALKHHELSSAAAPDIDQADWATAKGLLLGGAVDQYWTLVNQLTDRQKQRASDSLTQAGEQLDAANRRWTDSHVAFEKAAAAAQISLEEAQRDA